MTRGNRKLPPPDLAKRRVTLTPRRGKYYRCASISRPLVDWDERSTSRFSSPGNPVLYLAASWQTAFYEVFGDNLNDMIPEDRAIAQAELDDRQWVEYEIADPLATFDVTDAGSQRQIGADGATFRVPYGITQPWALGLHAHPGGIAAMEYASRLNDPHLCLAVFGSKPLVAQGQTLFNARKGLPLSKDPVFLFWLLKTARIAVK